MSGSASSLASSTFTVTVEARQCAITITQSGRATVSGKPGVYVDGTATGLPTGEALKVWVTFPGQTSYTEGSAKPVVDNNGNFEWSRKTVK